MYSRVGIAGRYPYMQCIHGYACRTNTESMHCSLNIECHLTIKVQLSAPLFTYTNHISKGIIITDRDKCTTP